MTSPARPRLPLLVAACAALATAAHARTVQGQTAPGQTAPSQTAAPSATAAALDPASAQAADPWEGLNRRSFALNSYLDRTTFRPLAIGYKRATPRPVRAGLHNAFLNLGEPVTAVNDLLQLRFSDFGRSAGRFVLNSAFGFLGLVDVAAGEGVPHHDNDFGLTLARDAHVRSGPYLFVPLRGPSTLRDGLGQGVDVALNPFTWISYPYDDAVGAGSVVIGGLDTRAAADKDLKQLRNLSTDEYATIRSFYLQNRAAQITGKAVDVNALPAFDDPGAPQAGAPAAPAAPGSISPTGERARPDTGLAGDAGALPRPAGSESTPSSPTPPSN